MDNSKKYFLTLGIISFILFSSLLFFTINEYKKEYFDLNEVQFFEYSDIRQSKINYFFYERVKSASAISNFEIIKNIIKTEKEFDLNVTKKEAIRATNLVSKKIENYLIVNRDLTVEELSNNPEFLELCEEYVGNEGYTTVIIKETLYNIYHPNEKLIGKKIDTSIVSEDFIKMIDELNIGKKNSSSFYYLISENEPIFKYSYAKEIPLKTKDNQTLIVIATINYDDLKIVKNISKKDLDFLKEIIKIKKYHSINILDDQGKLIFDVTHGGNGINVSKFDYGLYLAYLDSKENKTSSIIGPTYHEFEDRSYYVYSIIIPIIEKEKILGYLGIQIEKDFDKLFLEGKSPSSNEYLVNREYLLSSSTPEFQNSILIQEVKTENSKNCFKNKRDIIKSNNFFGEEIYGITTEIYAPELCLLIEFTINQFNINLNNLKIFIIYTLIIFSILTFSFLKLFQYSKKRYEFKKIRINFAKKIFKKIDSIENTPFYLISLIILFSYLFILEYFLKGVFYDSLKYMVPDFILCFSVLVFLKRTKEKNLEKRKYLLIGGIIIFVERIFEIFMQKYEIYRGLQINLEIWAALMLLFLIGFSIFINGIGGKK